jgi:hypothetical protein
MISVHAAAARSTKNVVESKYTTYRILEYGMIKNNNPSTSSKFSLQQPRN